MSATFQSNGVLLALPEVVGSGVLARVIRQFARPEDAETILEDRCDVDLLALYLHPVYAFELQWPQKGRFVVVECDGLTGEVRTGRTRKDLAH